MQATKKIIALFLVPLLLITSVLVSFPAEAKANQNNQSCLAACLEGKVVIDKVVIDVDGGKLGLAVGATLGNAAIKTATAAITTKIVNTAITTVATPAMAAGLTAGAAAVGTATAAAGAGLTAGAAAVGTATAAAGAGLTAGAAAVGTATAAAGAGLTAGATAIGAGAAGAAVAAAPIVIPVAAVGAVGYGIYRFIEAQTEAQTNEQP